MEIQLEPEAQKPATCPRCFSKDACFDFWGAIYCASCEESFHPCEMEEYVS